MNINVLATVSAIVGVAGIIGSLLVSSFQARELARQTRLQNLIAITSSLREVMYSLETFGMVFLEHPELRPFFYGNRACPDSGRLRDQVLCLAELLADKLEVGLHTITTIKETNSEQDWRDYLGFMLANSPTLRQLLNDHGSQWWPLIAKASREGVETAASTSILVSASSDEDPRRTVSNANA